LGDPAQRAKLLSGALLILDNADDPYEKSRKEIGSDKGWFEGKLLNTYEASYRRLLLTIRDETDSALFQKPSMRKKDTQLMKPLTLKAGREMLQHEMEGVELTEADEASILRVCGARGVSPLALSVVCGVLRHEFDDDLSTEADRASYLADLGNAVARAGSDYNELQTVMEHSIVKVPVADRTAFLQLHLFPDRFTESDAAALWGTTDKAARELLRRLKRASLVDYAAALTQKYLVLDHLWHFADRYARDPNCKWLSRTDQALAIQRLIELGQRTDPSNERLLSAARIYARDVLSVIDHAAANDGTITGDEDPLGTNSLDDEEVPWKALPSSVHAPAFRSMGSDAAAYAVRNVHSSVTMPCKDHAGLSRVDLEFIHGLEEKHRHALERAARDLMRSVPPPPCAPASGAAKRKRA
jgi:hypothetical protein